jgi:hypothetical protein
VEEWTRLETKALIERGNALSIYDVDIQKGMFHVDLGLVPNSLFLKHHPKQKFD